MSKKTLTLELTLRVKYNPHGVSTEVLKNYLRVLINFGLGDGLLTGNTPAEVESHSVTITPIKE